MTLIVTLTTAECFDSYQVCVALLRNGFSLVSVLLYLPILTQLIDTALGVLQQLLPGSKLPWSPALSMVRSALQARANDPAPGKFRVLLAAGVYLLAREGSNAVAAAKLRALLQALERQEPRNPALWLRLAQPYARLAGTPSFCA